MYSMFSDYVKMIFDDSLKKDGFTFREINKDRTIFSSNDFDILITYDEREENIYIDFDLSRYFEKKKYPNKLQFPIYLNIDNIYTQLGYSLNDFSNTKGGNIDDRLKLKYRQFIFIWKEILSHEEYTEFLSTLLINERLRLKDINHLNEVRRNIDIAHKLFKSKNYDKVYQILVQYKEHLNEYDKKILDYAIRKKKQ